MFYFFADHCIRNFFYSTNNKIRPVKYNLVFLTCFLISYKYYSEIYYQLKISDLRYFSDYIYKTRHFFRMQKLILKNVNYDLFVLTPFDFIDIFFNNDSQEKNYIFSIAALSVLMENKCKPSTIGRAAILLSNEYYNSPIPKLIYDYEYEDKVNFCYYKLQDIYLKYITDEKKIFDNLVKYINK